MAGKKTTKTNTKSTSKKKTAEDISAKKQLNAIIFFALGIIFTALALIPGESLWESLHYMTRGLFGWCSYLIGPVFIYLAVMNTLEKSAFSTTAQGIESAVLILLLSGVTTVLNEGMELSGNVFDKIGMLYTNGKELIGGGVISTVCGLTFIALMGRVAAVIVSFVLIALVLMLITGTTLRGLADNTKKVGIDYRHLPVFPVVCLSRTRDQCKPRGSFRVVVRRYDLSFRLFFSLLFFWFLD